MRLRSTINNYQPKFSKEIWVKKNAESTVTCRNLVYLVISLLEFTCRNLVYLVISLLECKHSDFLITNSTYQ